MSARNKFSNFWNSRVKKVAVSQDQVSEKFRRDAYSQEGEDLLLLKLLQWKRNGFYLDVGAHHPYRYSNTAILNRDFGWSGCNIDPLPGTKELFDQYRRGDINIEVGVAGENGRMTFFHFNPEAYSTFDSIKAEKLIAQGVELVKKQKIDIKPLSQILCESGLEGRTIDLMNLDVEGLELEVLNSFDFNDWEPKVICVEVLNSRWENLVDDPVFMDLQGKGYVLRAKTVNTCVFEKV